MEHTPIILVMAAWATLAASLNLYVDGKTLRAALDKRMARTTIAMCIITAVGDAMAFVLLGLLTIGLAHLLLA